MQDLTLFCRGCTALADVLYSNRATPIPERDDVVLGNECVAHVVWSSMLKVRGPGQGICGVRKQLDVSGSDAVEG